MDFGLSDECRNNLQNLKSKIQNPKSKMRYRWKLNRRLQSGAALLAFLITGAVLSDFFAPYGYAEVDKERNNAPPSRLHWVDAQGGWHWRPHIYEIHLADRVQMIYSEDQSQSYSIRFFVKGETYHLFGLFPCRVRLFGVEAPGKIFILGSDSLGRDVFSRLLAGARLSLAVAGAALLLSFPFALLIGSLAGYYGGKVDFISMRLVELFMALPSLYLVIALRSALPLGLEAKWIALAMIAVIALFGWAGLARIVRGMVVSFRQREFVVAAAALGASDWRIIGRHILPQLIGLALIQAAVAAPGFILAEVTLSYLGLGIDAPLASWGTMLREGQSVQTLVSFWWNLAPVGAIFIASLAFHLLAEGLRDLADPHAVRLTMARSAF